MVSRQNEETACDNAKRIQVVHNHIQYHAFYIPVELECYDTRPSSLVCVQLEGCSSSKLLLPGSSLHEIGVSDGREYEITVFLDTAPCSVLKPYQYFGETCKV
jgi:hypothetical protein